MSSKKLTRRSFITGTSAGIAAGAFASGLPLSAGLCSFKNTDISSAEGFSNIIEKYLPPEPSYEYHKRLTSEPVHFFRRDREARLSENEAMIPDKGWEIIFNPGSSVILRNAAEDFRDYLEVAHNVGTVLHEMGSLQGWNSFKNCIIAATRDQLENCGSGLKGSKDYEIIVSDERIVVCGYDEPGVMYGLFHLESIMNLREAPFLPRSLHTVRHSLYRNRMVLSWMGWMEWPDNLLCHLAHDGFDAIFASVYANPNGDRTTAENSTDFYARLLYRVRNQDPARIHDLIKRASRFGIKVYTQIIYQFTGTPESEQELRTLVRNIVNEFPEIKGYVLLTEGFWYKKWGGGHGASREYIEEWARNWCRAVGIVEGECHMIDPAIEILPWEYNINFQPSNSDVKRYFIKQLPGNTIPLLTWENGKSFELDGMSGYLRDYSLNQVGPAEVTEAQIDEANSRGMKVYSKVDTFASWQYGTVPYLPCPYQWYKRYSALEKYGVKGTLESWSSGYKPNFISQIRSWTCWSDAPSRDELFGAMASMIFGKEQKETVLKAWDHFSEAIRLVPDTGPNMGTNNAIGNPLFFREPPIRTVTYNHSWSDPSKLMEINPYWPFTVSRMVFFPDLSNKTNRAENYARSATGIQAGTDVKLLPVFLKYLKMAGDRMEEGLKLYREAAARSPESKREAAIREVIVAEQMQRMIQSDYAILEFEDLRLQLSGEKDNDKRDSILDRLAQILREEISRTRLSLIAAIHDSRLGFQFEQDYVYTPYSLSEKIKLLEDTLNVYLPETRWNKGNKGQKRKKI
jgi:hypothetical protein